MTYMTRIEWTRLPRTFYGPVVVAPADLLYSLQARIQEWVPYPFEEALADALVSRYEGRTGYGWNDSDLLVERPLLVSVLRVTDSASMSGCDTDGCEDEVQTEFCDICEMRLLRDWGRALLDGDAEAAEAARNEISDRDRKVNEADRLAELADSR